MSHVHMSNVQYTLVNDIAFLTINDGKVNSLGFALRSTLFSVLQAAIEDDQVAKIVIEGNGKFFSAGADIYEFNTQNATKSPLLPEIISLIRDSPKLIVAAVNGIAFGGGFELALAAHLRVGFSLTQFRLPEVSLGLIPGAGGTQLLPRVIDIGKAVEIIVKATVVDGSEALKLGVISELYETLDRQQLYKFVKTQEGIQRIDEAPVPLDYADELIIADLTKWIEKRKRGYDAQKIALKSVLNSHKMPLKEGIASERADFLALLSGTQFSALKHLFASEKGLYPRLGLDQFKEIRFAAVIGGGLMGRGICMSLVNAGIVTTIIEQSPEALERTLNGIKETYDKMVQREQIKSVDRDQALSLIQSSIDYQAIKNVDIVIEAVYEDMDLKKSIFEQLDGICAKETMFVSNTSRLDINELGSVTKRESLFLGMHFFSPAHLMKLVEIVKGNKTSQYALNSVIELSKRMNKLGVVVGGCEGFVGNRMLTTYRNEALFVLEEGARVSQVDQALYNFGMAMGPFIMTDMAGLDISWAARKRLQESGEINPFRDSIIGDRLCEIKRFGQKTGAGYYRYEKGSYAPIADPVVERVIEACAKEKDISRRSWSDAEIIERTIFALINEGFKILEEGIVSHSSAIDLVYIHGYGFPAYRGGPMFYADTIGLPKILEKMNHFAKHFGEHWQPSALLVDLVAKGLSVTDYRKKDE